MSLYVEGLYVDKLTGEGQGLHLPRLEKLSIHYCPSLTDTGLGALLQMAGQNLTDLNLSYIQCTGNGLAGLALHLPRLEKLQIDSFYRLKDAGLEALLQMAGHNLTDLTLTDIKCTGNGLAGLALHLPRLEKLEIAGALGFTDTLGLGALLQMAGQNLTYLSLSYIQFTGEGLTGLALNFPQLVKLNLGGCRRLTDAGLKEILLMPGEKLTDLNLSCTEFTGQGLTGLALKFPQLEQLDLEGCERLTDAGLKEILLMPGEKLTDLNLSDNMLTGNGLAGLALKFPQLKSLNLELCHRLTDAGLKEILLMPGEKLTDLNLSYNMLTGNGLAGLALKFPQLESLNLQRCDRLTDAGLKEILLMPGEKLTDLNLSCTEFTGKIDKMKWMRVQNFFSGYKISKGNFHPHFRLNAQILKI